MKKVLIVGGTFDRDNGKASGLINKIFNSASLVNPATFLGIENKKGDYYPLNQKDIFNANLYYSLYPDLQKNIGYNAEMLYKHLKEHGLYEGRKFSYVFDADYYYNKYEDLRKNVGNNKDYLLAHFLEAGINEGRQATPVFCVDYYLKKYKMLLVIIKFLQQNIS